jgi:hypothetical protein
MSGASVIEAILLRWGETHSTGRTVTFLLPDDGGEHPFKALKCGPDNGQRVALSVALIADNETRSPMTNEEKTALVERHTKPAKERKRWDELTLCAQASIRCGEPDFDTFIRTRTTYYLMPGDMSAADIVRQECGVNTRKLLDQIPDAAARWRRLDYDYRLWLQRRESTHA